jgi:antitoxin (DNA-binding transcriptional repressor) of toxin-antitoxin stability system
MPQLTIAEARRRFSEIVEDAHTNHQTYVVIDGRTKKEVARITPPEPRKTVKIGLLKGRASFRWIDDSKMEPEDLFR